MEFETIEATKSADGPKRPKAQTDSSPSADS